MHALSAVTRVTAWPNRKNDPAFRVLAKALGNHVRDILHYTPLKRQLWVPKLLVTVTVVCKVKRPLGDSDIPEGKVVRVPKFSITIKISYLFFSFLQKIIVSVVVNSWNEKGFSLIKLWKHRVSVVPNCCMEQKDGDVNIKINYV